MDENLPRVRETNRECNAGDTTRRRRRRRRRRHAGDHDVNGGDSEDDGGSDGRDGGSCGEDSMECSGKHCRSCTAGMIADCVALCCCPCGVVNILALALIKVPYKVGRRCLGIGKKKEKSKRKCKKIEMEGSGSITDGSLIMGNGVNEGNLGISLSGLSEDHELDDEAEKFWLELYRVGQLGFGRVSFTGAPAQSPSQIV